MRAHSPVIADSNFEKMPDKISEFCRKLDVIYQERQKIGARLNQLKSKLSAIEQQGLCPEQANALNAEIAEATQLQMQHNQNYALLKSHIMQYIANYNELARLVSPNTPLISYPIYDDEEEHPHNTATPFTHYPHSMPTVNFPFSQQRIEINIHNSQFFFHNSTHNNTNLSLLPSNTEYFDKSDDDPFNRNTDEVYSDNLDTPELSDAFSADENNNNNTATSTQNITNNTTLKKSVKHRSTNRSKREKIYQAQLELQQKNAQRLWVKPGTTELIKETDENFNTSEKEEITLGEFKERKKIWIIPIPFTCRGKAKENNPPTAGIRYRLTNASEIAANSKKRKNCFNSETVREVSLAELEAMDLHLTNRKTGKEVIATELDNYNIDQVTINKSYTLRYKQTRVKYNTKTGEIFNLDDPVADEQSSDIIIINLIKARALRRKKFPPTSDVNKNASPEAPTALVEQPMPAADQPQTSLSILPVSVVPVPESTLMTVPALPEEVPAQAAPTLGGQSLTQLFTLFNVNRSERNENQLARVQLPPIPVNVLAELIKKRS